MKRIVSRVKLWYRNLSLAKKIHLSNLAVITILIIISGFFANRVVNDIIVKRTLNNSKQGLNNIIENLNHLLDDVEKTCQELVEHKKVQEVLSKPKYADTPEGWDNYVVVRTIMENITSMKTVINSASIYGIDGRLVGSGFINTNEFPNHRNLKGELVQQAFEGKGDNIWLDNNLVPYQIDISADQSITMLKAVMKSGISTDYVLGVLEVKISQNIFSKLYTYLDYAGVGRFIIVNKQGMIIFPDKDNSFYDNLVKENFVHLTSNHEITGRVYNYQKESFLISSNRFERLGWIIIGIIPLDDLIQDNKKVTNIIYFVGVICILLQLVFSIVMSESISKPITDLCDSMMSAAQGDLEVRVNIVRNDEIGYLSKTFNKMIDQISQLMEQVYIDQKKKRELELLSLQSQINPHFLYNTLESVCSLAQLGRTEDVFSMSKALAMFYRGALSKGRNIIDIREEIKNIQHYLTIQKIRYMNNFDYQIRVEEDILPVKIIKLSIQPLVENAIYHGIKGIRGKGKIWIVGRKKQDTIIISVIDNGIGLKEDQLHEMLLNINNRLDKHSFGLRNVDERIKLYFGNKYGLRADSRLGKWTKVDIILPLNYDLKEENR
ncbi:sensor histidine kinase [Petroclostridium sp. X23]|uniref:sensor histidine kinase n=1 Tax=Petroclostridium sp. X23 TaxID=3045146 RepID=UPI0024ACF182|nr:sensor histidine kinase [Petroclostridium sp. X23]WHH60365.1 sensor histidine kinase [Petroclostridium sp. X23]